MKVPIEFFLEWFKGPSNAEVREIGYGVESFTRMGFTLEGFEYFLEDEYRRIRRKSPLYMSIGLYEIDVVGESVTEEYARENGRFDTLHYDFDSEEDPEAALKVALEFARRLSGLGIDPVIYVTGCKGARVVVPLKEPLPYDRYAVIWEVVAGKYKSHPFFDRHMVEPNRLSRVPYTYNVKDGEVKGFAYLIDLRGRRLRAEDFSWSNYEPLDPRRYDRLVDIKFSSPLKPERPKQISFGGRKRRLQSLPAKIEELADCEAVPPCIREMIKRLKEEGELEHYERWVLVCYLKWIGFTVDDVVGFFARHAKDFNERKCRYQVEYIYGLRGCKRNWLMPSCRTLKEGGGSIPGGMCRECGWDKNPVTYTYARALVPEDIKNSFFEEVRRKSL